jgi:hypothetical protein
VDQSAEQRIEESLGEIKSAVASMDKTLAVQATQLEYHIRRTDLLEKRIEKFESWRWFFVGMGAIVALTSKLMGWI